MNSCVFLEYLKKDQKMGDLMGELARRTRLALQELPDDVLVLLLKHLPVFPYVVLLTG